MRALVWISARLPFTADGGGSCSTIAGWWMVLSFASPSAALSWLSRLLSDRTSLALLIVPAQRRPPRISMRQPPCESACSSLITAKKSEAPDDHLHCGTVRPHPDKASGVRYSGE